MVMQITDFLPEHLVKRFFLCCKIIDAKTTRQKFKELVKEYDEKEKLARSIAKFHKDEHKYFQELLTTEVEECEKKDALMIVGHFKILVRVIETDRENKNAPLEKKALKMLQNGDALKYCLEVLSKRHIGEQHILLLLLASGISSGLRKRQFLLHCMGVGGSGKGKTDAMEITGKIFTNCDTIISASPKNIFYQADDMTLVDNGILFFPENDAKDNDEFNALERVLTDDKDIVPKHETVINQQSKSLEITQLNVMWRNSVGTSNDEDNQINNRYFIFNVDESHEQDKKVFKHILDNWNISQITDNEDLNICKAMTDIIKSESKTVIIPYLRGISLTNKTDRRTIKKFLKLITSITYFNRFQRIQSNKYIFSNIEDLNIANLIWQKINRYETSKLPEYETTILDIVAQHGDGISLTDLSKLLKKDKGNLSKKIKDMEFNGQIYAEIHNISEYSEQHQARINKPIKLLSCTVIVHSCIGYCTSDENIKLAIQDLEALNIEELTIPKSRYCKKIEKVSKKEKEKLFEIFKNQIFNEINVSHLLNNVQQPNVNIYNNNIYIYNNSTIGQIKKNLESTTTSTIAVQQQHNNLQQPTKRPKLKNHDK